MTRSTLTADNRVEAVAASLTTVELVRIDLPGGALHFATGDRVVSFGGDDYLPTGILAGTGAAQETGDLRARTVTLSFSGVDAALVSRFRTEDWQFSPVDVWLGFLDADGALVDDPYPIAPSMVASSCVITLDAGRADIALEVETDDVFMARNSAVLATDGVQRRRYEGDTGLSTVAAIAEQTIQWGGQRQQVGIQNPGGYGFQLPPNTGVPRYS